MWLTTNIPMLIVMKATAGLQLVALAGCRLLWDIRCQHLPRALCRPHRAAAQVDHGPSQGAHKTTTYASRP